MTVEEKSYANFSPTDTCKCEGESLINHKSFVHVKSTRRERDGYVWTEKEKRRKLH